MPRVYYHPKPKQKLPTTNDGFLSSLYYISSATNSATSQGLEFLGVSWSSNPETIRIKLVVSIKESAMEEASRLPWVLLDLIYFG